MTTFDTKLRKLMEEWEKCRIQCASIGCNIIAQTLEVCIQQLANVIAQHNIERYKADAKRTNKQMAKKNKTIRKESKISRR